MSTETRNLSKALELAELEIKELNGCTCPGCSVHRERATYIAEFLHSILTTPPSLAGEGGEAVAHTQRWNIERDGRDLLICDGEHEKAEGCTYVRYTRHDTAPPTLAPSQGTAVTDGLSELVDDLEHIFSGAEDIDDHGGPNDAMRTLQIVQKMRAALASPAVRDEVAAPEWLREFIEKYRLAPLDWDTLASWFRSAHEERLRLREEIAELRTHQKVAAAGGETFQVRVAPWMQACFGEAISRDVVERGDRFLEEALELLQANGYDRSRIATLVDYVWGRPVGEPSQEVGGVMVTLAAYCLATGLDMHAAGETELARIWTKVEQIRAKQASKAGLHTPLPVPAASILAAEDGGGAVPDAWLIPKIVHFYAGSISNCPVDQQPIIEGTVAWRADKFCDSQDIARVDKHGVSHYPKPLYLAPPSQAGVREVSEEDAGKLKERLGPLAHKIRPQTFFYCLRAIFSNGVATGDSHGQ